MPRMKTIRHFEDLWTSGTSLIFDHKPMRDWSDEEYLQVTGTPNQAKLISSKRRLGEEYERLKANGETFRMVYPMCYDSKHPDGIVSKLLQSIRRAGKKQSGRKRNNAGNSQTDWNKKTLVTGKLFAVSSPGIMMLKMGMGGILHWISKLVPNTFIRRLSHAAKSQDDISTDQNDYSRS
jgi:hypothetical protein